MCKLGATYGRKKGALCIKYIKFSTSTVISRAFGATK